MRTLFFRLPRLATLAILVALIGGVGALSMLGRQEDPTLIERYGYVLVTVPGADAERMEALVTEPLEAALMELPEINELLSVSRAGVTQVSLDMREDLTELEVDNAWNLVRQKTDQARAEFPPGATPPEVVQQYVGAATLVVSLTWDGDSAPPLAVMRRMALDLEDRFQRLPGTEETNTHGLPREEIRIVADPEALSSIGLSMRQAAAIIGGADAKRPAGRLRAPGGNLGLEVGGEFDSIARIRAVPLMQRPDGSAVRVGDVADVRKGVEQPATVSAMVNGERAVLVSVFISTGQRVDKWAETARAEVADFEASAPEGLGVNIAFDQSTYTVDRLGGLARNLMYSALIVFLVLFLTMGWRSAFIVGTAIPLTICLVLVLFNLFGHPLHQMSVTGLVIALGLLIDNAIVVVDEFDQMRAKGADRLRAIDESLRHLFAPLAASTLTTALAFAPIALLPGGAGEFVGMVGLSVIFAVVSSFVISMTVIPAMAGWFDRQRSWETGQSARRRQWWRDGVAIDFISDGYRATVEAVLRFPILGIAVGVVPAFIGFFLVTALPFQFFPQTERDQFQISLNLPDAANLNDTLDVARRANEIINGFEGVETVNWVVGEPSPRVYYNMINNTRGVEGFAAGWVQLDNAKRTRELVADIQSKVRQEFPSAQFLALPFEQGPPANAPIEYFLRGDDFVTLGRLGDESRSILAGTPGITYTTASLQLGAPTLRLRAGEAETAIAGGSLTDLAADLSVQMEGALAGSILEGTEELPVRVLAPMSRRGNLQDLQSMMVGAGPDGIGTPISSLGDMTLEPKTAVITRKNGQRVNQVLAFLDPYTLPGEVLGEFETRLEASGFELPSGYDRLVGGEAENSGDALGNLAGVGIPLILVMAGAIMLVFNSFRMMLLILTTGFLSMGLAFFGVWLFNLPLGFNAILGALGLLGISINGSIVVLSLLRASPGAMADDVLVQREVVVDATRHIVATTLTTMGGFVPILLTGDAFWMPLAAAISGGVAGSALLALYFTPAVFRIMRWKPVATWLKSRDGRIAPTAKTSP